MLLKCTTRHVRIFTAEVENDQLIESEDKLTLDIDPDNELEWNDAALQEVYQRFESLIAACEGQDLTNYNLRRIGSDLEHYIRSLLMAGKVSYNLNSRVKNFSLGVPRYSDEDADNHLAIK